MGGGADRRWRTADGRRRGSEVEYAGAGGRRGSEVEKPWMDRGADRKARTCTEMDLSYSYIKLTYLEGK